MSDTNTRLGDIKVDADHELAVQEVDKATVADNRPDADGDEPIIVNDSNDTRGVVGRIDGGLENPTAGELRAKGYTVPNKADGSPVPDDERVSKWSSDTVISDPDDPNAVQLVDKVDLGTSDPTKTALELIAEQESNQTPAESPENPPKSGKKQTPTDSEK